MFYEKEYPAQQGNWKRTAEKLSDQGLKRRWSEESERWRAGGDTLSRHVTVEI